MYYVSRNRSTFLIESHQILARLALRSLIHALYNRHGNVFDIQKTMLLQNLLFPNTIHAGNCVAVFCPLFPSLSYITDRPTIVFTEATVIASEGSDVQLPCTARGNPSLITTKWLWNGKHLPKSSNPVIFPNGTLLLKNVNADLAGIYKCTPFNKIGVGNSVETILKVESK